MTQVTVGFSLLDGRLAQLVRAPRLHRGGRGFESLSAHPLFCLAVISRREVALMTDNDWRYRRLDEQRQLGQLRTLVKHSSLLHEQTLTRLRRPIQ